jgi:hypothetical protein
MFEKMEEPFRQLARTIQSVETWTGQMLALKTLKSKDRQLIEKLAAYTDHCRRKSENWLKKSAAERAIKKLDNLWALLLLDVIMEQDTRRK